MKPAGGFDLCIVEAGGDRLPCIVRGAGNALKLLIIPPLFEEMNRTRRLLALAAAHLARAGVESWFPDLPGTGDHEDATPEWARWRASVAALAAHIGAPLHVAAIRGGALLADAVPAASLYRFAPPQSGAKQLRDLLRAAAAAEGGPNVAALEAASAAGATIEAAGYRLPPALVAALSAATLAPCHLPTRTVALAAAQGVDAVLDGPLVWRQSEPFAVPALAAALAADIARWLASQS